MVGYDKLGNSVGNSADGDDLLRQWKSVPSQGSSHGDVSLCKLYTLKLYVLKLCSQEGAAAANNIA